jgi:PAS domain S-box-containing protein
MNDQPSEQLKAMLDLLPASAWYANPSGGVTYVNKRNADYRGISSDHPLRQGSVKDAPWDSHLALLHPDDHDEARKVWSTCLKTGQAGEITFRVRNRSGEYRWFLSRAEPFRADDGTLLGWIGINFDVEERKRAEDKISEQEMELRQVLDLAPQMICVQGPQQERLYANRQALQYFGVTLEGWLTSEYWSVVHLDDIDRVKARVERSSLVGTADEMEMRLKAGDGTYRWFLVRYSPLRDEQGRLVRWYSASTDIEDRKKAEERLHQENVALREEIDKASMFEEIVGASPALNSLLSRVAKVAGSDSTVLITGETGTGKELVARAIHRRSRRATGAFVAVNCAALSRELVASELFGHEKGAFTGATQKRLGRFELADGGTIFLDEVGELFPETQVALLRVLQERSFERVGGTQPIRVDVRVIAASNRDLNTAVDSGAFRQDLFYRLNVFPLEAPPLRERKEDIPVLVEYFVGRYAKMTGKTFKRINKRTLDLLRAYPWPGNVRELQNVIERSVIVCEGDEFTVDESWLSPRPSESRPVVSSLANHEKTIIEEALRASGGRVFGQSGAAERLGIPRSTLESKIRTLNIDKSRFRSRPGPRH